MKKYLFALAATAAFVSVASAEDAWFNGGLGDDSLSGGEWTDPLPTGVTKSSTSYVLDGASSPLSFTATTAKAADDLQNLNFATSAKFSYSYDELPAVDTEAKAGVVVFKNIYYVLAKDVDSNPATNKWFSTGIPATLDSAVDVSVTITNGTDGAHALYTIGGSTFDKLVAASGNWGKVDYSGSGEVASLVGTTSSLASYPIPGEKTIPAATAEAWAAANGIAKADLGAVLLSEVLFNGRTAAESCLLGVATNAELKAEVVDNAADKLVFALNCTPVAERVVLTVMKKDAAAVESEVAGNTVSLAIADGVYQVVAEVDGANKQIPVSQEIGVKGTEVAASKVYFIGAPWADCPVTNLLKKTCCAAGDMMEVYDSEGDRWYTWTMSEGKWSYTADGNITADVEPELILKKGQAVKYTSLATGSVYTVGDVTTVAGTAIVKGVDKWNLVACPIGAFKASALPLDTNKAQAIVLGDDGVNATKLYRKVNSKVYVRDGYADEQWSAVTDTEELNGGFFLKTENTESVNWTQE